MKTVPRWTVILAGLSQMALLCSTGASAQTPATGTPASTLELARVVAPAESATNAAPLAAAPAHGQAETAALGRLRRDLGPGDRVSIVRTTGDHVSGRVLRVGETDLDLGAKTPTGGGPDRERLILTIPLDAIQSLERRRDSSKNGLLIGAAVGAGVSVALFAHAYAIDANEMDEWAAGYVVVGALFTGLGALVGWGIDAAHSKPHLRYDGPTHPTARVAVVPLRSRGLGMAMAVSF